MLERMTHHGATPRTLKSGALLVGNIYCGHCGNRLTLTTSGRKYERKDGSVRRETRARYQCHYKVRHPGECDGQSGYGVTKLDGIVEQIIRYQFSKIQTISSDTVIQAQNQKAIAFAQARNNAVCNQRKEKQRELDDYQSEILKIIRGESQFTAEMLTALMEKVESRYFRIEKSRGRCKSGTGRKACRYRGRKAGI